MYIIIGSISPSLSLPLLLHISKKDKSAELYSYIDDDYLTYKSFEWKYTSWKYHFLPRIFWPCLRLAFLKIKPLFSKINTLRKIH